MDGETLRSPQVSCSCRSGGHGILMVSGLLDDRPIRPSWFSPIRIFFIALVDDLYGQTVVVIVIIMMIDMIGLLDPPGSDLIVPLVFMDLVDFDCVNHS